MAIPSHRRGFGDVTGGDTAKSLKIVSRGINAQAGEHAGHRQILERQRQRG